MLRLTEWIAMLGTLPTHQALLVADAGVSYTDIKLISKSAIKTFGSVSTIITPAPVDGPIEGANTLFYFCAKHCEKLGPWLWLEPDAVPLHPNWLGIIHRDYLAFGQRLMGAKYQSDRGIMLSGVAIYEGKMGLREDYTQAFDVANRDIFVPLAADSKLFQNFWGQPGLPPTFVERRDASTPANAFTIDVLPGDHLDPDAQIFHRQKDGSLISLLKARMGLGNDNLAVVLPFCNRDAPLAQKLIDWIAELKSRYEHTLILSYDDATPTYYARNIGASARRCFRVVEDFVYPHPAGPVLPQTWAFVNAADRMTEQNSPWLWMEADCVPLKPEWLDVLQLKYRECGKPFCGPVVPVMFHMNGTGIYPPDALSYFPRAASDLRNAWDVMMKPEMMGYCADLQPYFQHCWGVDGDRLHPFSGAPPSFSSQQLVDRWIDPRAVIFHRTKDGSLIDRLRERRRGR